MDKVGHYNWDAAPKADSENGYGIGDHSGLNPGTVPLPATNRESSTAKDIGKKKKKATITMNKKASEALATGFLDELQKLGFGAMALPGATMRQGGVVTSKSKKKMGKMRIVSSKSRKMY
jgi:hypothetical protein